MEAGKNNLNGTKNNLNGTKNNLNGPKNNLKNNTINNTSNNANNNIYDNNSVIVNNNLSKNNNLNKNNNNLNLNKDFENLNKTLKNNNLIDTNSTNNTNNKKNGLFSSTANTVSEYTETISENSTLMLVLKVILVLVLLVVLIKIIKYYYDKWEIERTGSPMLVDGTKNAKNAFVISQDPNHTNYIPIKRSVNQDGIEFSYSLWFLVNDFSYKQGEWKHIFHKGNSSSYPNRAPGVWIHPNTNMIRIYMNTMKTLLEFVDIDNIPLRKWVHLTIVVKNRSLLIYVNGYLKIKKELSSLPRQNYGNVWTNMYGGYEGYLAKLQYFDKAITPYDIDDLVSQGPGTGNCIDTKEIPPYLDDSWWLN